MIEAKDTLGNRLAYEVCWMVELERIPPDSELSDTLLGYLGVNDLPEVILWMRRYEKDVLNIGGL